MNIRPTAQSDWFQMCSILFLIINTRQQDLVIAALYEVWRPSARVLITLSGTSRSVSNTSDYFCLIALFSVWLLCASQQIQCSRGSERRNSWYGAVRNMSMEKDIVGNKTVSCSTHQTNSVLGLGTRNSPAQAHKNNLLKWIYCLKVSSLTHTCTQIHRSQDYKPCD